MRNYKELILVVTASSIMLCLGMKAVKSRTSQWKVVKCQSHLKAIYTLALKYQNDHNGNIVTVVDKTKRRWRWWYKDLLPYAKNPYIFYCPATKKAEYIFKKEGDDPLIPKTFSYQLLSYGINCSLGRIEKKRKTTVNIKDVKNPEHVIYFGDSQRPYLRGTKWCWKLDYAPRHNNRSNFVLMDGSVKLMDYNTLGLCQKWKEWKKDKARWISWTRK